MPNVKTPPEKHDHEPLEFPPNFLWGAGTSAFQVEGGIKNSEWWQWEQTALPLEKRSGESANQYHLYKEDFNLLKQLGHNSHRLGLEWSRIEPEPGHFNEKEIQHYVQKLKFLEGLGINVMLTLHHFSNPAWFAKEGGWTNPKSAHYFNRFVAKIIPYLRPYVDLWITINEPGTYVRLAYHTAEFPPQQKSNLNLFTAYWNMAQAHNQAYQTIHRLVPNAAVGFANVVQSYNALHHHSLLENLAQWILDILGNHSFYLLTGKNTHDFIALNYYTNQYISFNGQSRIPSFLDIEATKKDVSDMGWEIYPEGMFQVIMDFSDYHKPVYITENGIASTNDDRRVRFLLSYLKEIYHAIKAGADVRGYYYWSLIDNMELHRGYDPRFGLVEVDFTTQKRTPRPSAYVYREIIRHNGIPHELLALLGHGINVKQVIKLGRVDLQRLHQHLAFQHEP